MDQIKQLALSFPFQGVKTARIRDLVEAIYCVMVIVVEVGRKAQILQTFALLTYLCFWLCWVFGAACRLCLAAVHGLLLAVAFLVEEHRL